MRICIYGAGAVGGHIAGRLAKGGAEVCLIARGPHLAAIQANGLRVETSDGVIHIHPKASDNPRTLGPQDAVIVTVKAPSLRGVAAGIGSLMHQDTLAVFAMNGIPWWYFHAHEGPFEGTQLSLIDPDKAVSNAVGPERAVGAVAYTACTIKAPGVIYAENPRNRIVLGRADGSVHPQDERLAIAMQDGGLEVEVTTRIRDAVWTKLLMNMIGGSLGILTGSPMKHALANPATAAAAAAMAYEGAAIARAMGCDPGDPEAGLPRLALSAHKQSILQDLELGRSMEIDALLRVPLELGQLAGVATPTLDLIVGLAVQRARSAGLYEG
jgi:2-dehydropantoate 2-reductase